MRYRQPPSPPRPPCSGTPQPLVQNPWRKSSSTSSSSSLTRSSSSSSLFSTLVFTILILIPSISAGPIGDTVDVNFCLKSCSSSSFWRYKPGTTYSYEYSVRSVTGMRGTSDQESVFSFKSRIQIGVSSPCNFVLQISSVELLESPDNAQSELLEQALTGSNLEFGFEQGKVRSVCHSNSDPIWVLNIKKGILSAFQQSVSNPTLRESIVEKDIVGECETEYSPVGVNWGKQTFRKVKDMSSCTKNQVLYQYALNLPDINIQHLPLLKSSHECEVSMTDGRLENVHCTEEHLFKPFSNGENGASSAITQTLTHLGEEEKKLPSSNFQFKTDLSFIHDHQRADGNADEDHVKQLLESFTKVQESQIPTLFNNVVYSLRNLKHSQLIKTFREIQDDRVKSFFLDALPILKTDAGVSLMRDVIKSGFLPSKTVDGWFSSLAFYKNPTRAMISTLSTLLDDPRQSSILGISSLVSTFCFNKENCKEQPEVHEVLRILESMLGDSCATATVEDEDKIVLVLKGIRNLQTIDSSGENSLRKCYQKKSNSVWVRLAALEATRKMSCNFVQQDFGLLRTFKDRQEDSEIRIGAYLALFDCPSESSVENIRSLLKDEPVNQVGSFIWTHLTNLQETKSKDDWKTYLKYMVGNEELKNKWNTDPRKFSRNLELSYFANDLRVGATIDSNIIFSEKSYIPRSGMVNLTANIFGENINIVEFGGRMEGFEDVVEQVFGPEGYFREDTIHKFVKSLRTKRDINENSLMGVRQLFGPDARIEEPRGNLYMRLFGKDLYYNSFNGLSSLRNNLISPLNYLGLKMGENNLDISKSSMFLDGCIIVPTVAGVPLNLTVNGTSTVRLITETKLDFKSIFQTGKGLMQAKIYPTATLEISGLMTVDAFIVKTGLKSVTKLHTSAYADIFIDIEQGRLAKVHVNLPTDKTEIIKASAEFFYYTSGGFKQLETVHQKESLDVCTPKMMSDVLGLEFCSVGTYFHGKNNFDPSWYFTGPASLELFMKKTDKFDKITFDYSWNTDNSRPHKGIMEDLKVILDTPGSTLNRKSYLQIKFDNKGNFYLVDLNLPLRKTRLELRYEWATQKKIIVGSLISDGSEILTISNQFASYPQKYEAFTKMVYMDVSIIDWQGVMYTLQDKQSLDATLKGHFHDPVELKGDYSKVNEFIKFASSIESSHIKVNFKSNSQLADNQLKTDAVVDYDFKGYQAGTIDVKGKYFFSQQGLLSKKKVALSIKPNQYPDTNTDISWELLSSENYLENDAEIKIGDKEWKIYQQINAQASMEEQELVIKMNVSSKTEDVNYALDFQHKLKETESYNKASIRLSKNFWIEMYSQHTEITLPYSFTAGAGISYPGREVKLGFNVSEPIPHAKEYNGGLYFQWNKGLEARTTFSFARGNSDVINYNFKSLTEIHGFDSINLNGNLILDSSGSNADMKWKFGEKEYGAVVMYTPGDEKKLTGVVTMNQVEYTGEIVLKDDFEEKMVIANLKAEQHIHLTAYMTSAYDDLAVEFYWDKDKDDSKSLILKSKISNRSVIAEVNFLGKGGKLTASYTPSSVLGKIDWGKYNGEIEGKFLLSSSEINLLASVKSSFHLLEDVRFHTKLLSDNDQEGRIFESKMELKLNEYHHMGEINFKRQLNKFEGKLETISSYKPFDNILVNIDHSLEAGQLQTIINLKYNEQFVALELMHSGNIDLQNVSGKHKIESSFSQIKLFEVQYDVKLVESSLTVSAQAYLNNSHKAKLTASGSVTSSNHDIKFEIEHSLGKYTNINGEFQYLISPEKISTEAKMESEGSKLMSSIKLDKSETSMNTDFRVEIESLKPFSFWFKYSTGLDGKVFQSEVMYENIQIFATNFKALFESRNNIKFTSAMKILSRKMSLNFENSKNETSFYYDVASGSTITTRIKTELKKEIKGEFKSSVVLLEIDSLNETFNDIKIVTKWKESDGKYALQTEMKYKVFLTKIEMKFKSKNEEFKHYLNVSTNILSESLAVTLERESTLNSHAISMKSVYGEKLINFHGNLSSESEVKTIFSSNITGTWGNVDLNGSLDLAEQKKTVNLFFQDRNREVFQLKVELQLGEDSFITLTEINTPFTDRLTVSGEFQILSGYKLLIKIDQPSFTYADLQVSLKKNTRSINVIANVDFKNLIDFPKVDLNGHVELKEEITGVWRQKEISNINSKFTLNIDGERYLLMKFIGGKTEYGLTGELELSTELAGIQDIKADLDIDLFGVESKHAEFKIGINKDLYSVRLQQETLQSKSQISSKITTPVQNLTSLGFDASFDNSMESIEIKLHRETDHIILRGDFKVTNSGASMAAKLESSMHSWKEIEVSCKMNLNEEVKELEIIGGSADNSQTVKIVIAAGETTGSAEVNIELPFIGIAGKNFLGSYHLTDAKYEVEGNFNGDLMALQILMNDPVYSFSLQTSVPGFQQVEGNLVFKSSQESIELTSDITVDSVTNSALFRYSFKDIDIEMALNSNFSLLKTFKVTAAFQPNLKKFSGIYNSHNIESLLQHDSNMSEVKLNLSGKISTLTADIKILYKNLNEKSKVFVSSTFNNTFSSIEINLYGTLIEVVSVIPKIGKSSVQVSWKNGEYLINFENNSLTYFRGSLEWNFINFWTGDFKIEINTLFDYVKTFSLNTSYDLGKVPDKAIVLKINYNGMYMDSDLKFKATHDTFDGKMYFKSSLDNWEEAIIKAAYSIDAEPDVKISILRNEVTEEIFVKITIDGYIPTIDIKTPFVGFESMKLSGTFTTNKNVFIQFEKNQDKLFTLDVDFTISTDWKKIEVTSKISILGVLKEDMNFNMKLEKNKQLAATLIQGMVTYGVDVNISLPEKAFKIKIILPSDDIEIAGQFGSTEFIATYSVGLPRKKREVSLGYKNEDDVMQISLQAPISEWKGVRFAAGYQADAKAANFNFETHGDNNDFAFGLKYDFSEYLTTGNLFGKLVYPKFNIDYNAKLQYDDVDGNFKNGFHGKFNFESFGVNLISGEIQRSIGRTLVSVTTPFEGWKSVDLSLVSDWASVITLELKRDGRLSKMNVERKNNSLFKLNILTPYPGYEKIDAKLEIPSGKPILIEIIKNDEVITKILFDNLVDHRIKIRWEALNKTFINIELSLEKQNEKSLEIKTSFEKIKYFKIFIAHEAVNTTKNTELKVELNDIFYHYKTSTNISSKQIDSRSITETNIPYLSYKKEETEMSVAYSLTMDSPITLKFKSIHDGITTFDVFSSILVNMQNGELELIYQGDFPLHSGKIDAKLIIRSDFETKLEVAGKLNSKNFKVKATQVGGNAEAIFKSNIENFENLQGTAKWIVAEGPTKLYGLDAIFNYQEKKYIGFKIKFDSKPCSQFFIELDIPGYMKESLDIHLDRMPVLKYAVTVAYKGFNEIELSANLDLTDIILDILVENKTESRKWALIVQGDIKNKNPVNIIFELSLETPFTEKFSSRVAFDLQSAKKNVETSFTYGDIHASLVSSILWSVQTSNLILEASCPSLGLNSFRIIGQRDSLKTMKYTFVLNDRAVELELRNHVKPDSFDIGMLISLPVPSYNKLSFFGKGNMPAEGPREGKFELIITDVTISLDYKRNNNNFDIILLTPLTFAKRISLKTEIEHCQNYNLEASWDNHNIKLQNEIDCSESEVKVDYITTFETVKNLEFQFKLADNHFNLNGKFLGFGNEIFLIAKSTEIENGQKIFVNLSADSFTFTETTTYIQTSTEKSIHYEVVINSTVELLLNIKLLNRADGVDLNINFSSPFPEIKEVQITLTFVNSETDRSGALFISLNEKSINIKIGSSQGHIFFDVKSPLENFETVKMDCNYQNGNLKVMTVFNKMSFNADFKRKETIYNFDIETKSSDNVIKFNGKIDIAGKALQTVIQWNAEKLSMKANYNGKNITISLKSPFENFKNIIFKGTWQEIPNGFTVQATGDINSVSHTFEAKFTRDEKQTFGFWKAQRGTDEVKFELDVKRPDNGMDISVKVEIPNLQRIQVITGFKFSDLILEGKFNINSPFKEIVPDFDIYFKKEFMSASNMSLEARVQAPQKIFGMESTFRIEQIDEYNIILLNAALDIPVISKDFTIECIFKPESLQDFEFSSNFMVNKENYGGGLSYKQEDHSLDVKLDIICPGFERTFKFGGEFRQPTPEGELKLYFNDAKWENTFDVENGKFKANSKINIDQFIHTTLGNFFEFDLSSGETVKINVEYESKKSVSFNLDIQGQGTAGVTFSVDNGKVLGSVDVDFSSFGIFKSAEFVWKTGSSGAFEISIVDRLSTFKMQMGDKSEAKRRVARAAIYSPLFGKLEFGTGSDYNQGVLMISTSHGLHKVSYDVKERNSYDVTVHLESPFLENGSATTRFTIDTTADTYRGRISLNNDHFLSGFVDISENGIEVKLDLETPYLPKPHKFSVGGTCLKKGDEYKMNLDVVYITKHVASLVLVNSELNKSFHIKTHSALIPTGDIEFKVYFNPVPMSYEGGIKLLYGDNICSLSFSTTFFTVNNFEIKSYFNFTAFKIRDGKFNICVHVNQEEKLKTSFEINSKKYELQVTALKDEILSTKVALSSPLKGFEYCEIHLKTAKTLLTNLKEAFVIISIFTSKGESFGSVSWKISNEEIDFLAKLDMPHGINYYHNFKLVKKDKSIIYTALSPIIGPVKFNIYSTVANQDDLMDERITWNLDILNLKYRGNIDFRLTDGYELNLNVETPHQGYKKQKLTLGFGNTVTRKTLKASIESLTFGTGIEMDYKFEELKNFIVLFKVDFPLPGWSDFSVDIANQIFDEFFNIRFGGSFEEKKALFSVFKSLNLGKAELIINKHNLESIYNHIGTNSSTSRKTLDTTINIGNLNAEKIFLLESSEKGNSVNLEVIVGGSTKCKISKSLEDNKFTILLDDVFSPMKFAGTMTYDINNSFGFSRSSVGTLGLESEIILDKSKSKTSKVIFNWIFRKATSGGNLIITVKPLNKDSFTFRLLSENFGHQSSYAIQLQKSQETILLLNRLGIQLISPTNKKYEDTLILFTPYYHFKCSAKHEKESQFHLSEGSVAYGIPGEQERGIGYSISTIQKEGEDYESKIVIRKPNHVLKNTEQLAIIRSFIDSKHILQIDLENDDPLKNLNFKVEGNFENGPQRANVLANINYAHGSSDKNEFDISLNLDKVNKIGRFEITTPENEVELEGKWKTKQGMHTSSLTLYSNRMKKFSMSQDYNNQRGNANINMLMPGDTTVTLFAGLESSSNAAFRIAHSYLGGDQEDVNVNINLIGGQQMATTVVWRKEMMKELKSYAKWAVDSFETAPISLQIDVTQILEVFEVFSKSVLNDVLQTQLKINCDQIRFDLTSHVNSMDTFLTGRPNINSNLLTYIINSVQNGIDVSINCLKTFLGLHGKIVTLAENFHSQLFINLKKFSEEMKIKIRGLKDLLMRNLKSIDNVIEHIMQHAEKCFIIVKGYLDSFLERYDTFLRKYSGGSSKAFFQFVIRVQRDVLEYLEAFRKYMDNFQKVKEIADIYKDLANWLEYVNFNQHLHETAEKLSRFLDESTRALDRVKEIVSRWIQNAKTLSEKSYEIAMQYPPFAYFVTVTTNWYNLGKDVMLHFLQDYHVRKLLDSVLTQANIYTATAFRLVDLMANKRDLFTYSLVYEPERGYIKHVQTLPIEWFEFNEVPKFLEMFSSSKKSPDFDITDFYLGMNDAVRSFSAMVATQTFLPPFLATATLIGDNHLVTFDGKLYDFAGNCSYLLTSDFGHNRFSIIANYKKQVRMSLTILVDNTTIEMFRDGRVFINKTRTELPRIMENTYIKQEGSRVILTNKQGFFINCNNVQNICKIKLSGWYFGRTGGLLGVYDNEPSNDWMLSTRHHTTDLRTFVESWNLEEECQADYVPVEESLNSWDREKCANLFLNEDSSLRPCFGIVNPTPYYGLCLKEMEMIKNKLERTRGFCLASAAYVESCKMNKVDIGHPLDCVNCETPLSSDIGGGHNIRYTNTVKKSADVIFIVEQKKCAETLKLKSLVALIESSLVEDLIKDNKYALVGYGGYNELSSPHVFTAGSQVYSDAIGIQTAFDGLNFIGEEGNVFDAIKYAARLTVRSSVSKIMVLVNCETIYDKRIFADTSIMLKEQDITLHYLAPTSFRLKNKAMNDIFGFDKNYVYTSSSLSTRTGDSALRTHLKTPKDYVSALSLNSGGLIFSQSNLLVSSSTEKQAATILGRQIARTGAPSTCQLCDCMVDDEGAGKVLCQKCIDSSFDILAYQWNKFGSSHA